MDPRAGQDYLEKRIELTTLSIPNLSLASGRTKLIQLPFKSFIFLPFLTSSCNIFPNTDMHNPPWFSLVPQQATIYFSIHSLSKLCVIVNQVFFTQLFPLLTKIVSIYSNPWALFDPFWFRTRSDDKIQILVNSSRLPSYKMVRRLTLVIRSYIFKKQRIDVFKCDCDGKIFVSVE